MNWKESEQEFLHVLSDVFQQGGKLEDSLEMQYKDIDAVDKRGITYSIKNQPSSEKTGNFAYETKLEDSRTGDTMDGSFTKCEADYYVVFREFKGVDWCFITDTESLRELVAKDGYKEVTTRLSVEQSSNQGRKFNRGHCRLVPVQDIYYDKSTMVFIKTPKKGWRLHNKPLNKKDK